MPSLDRGGLSLRVPASSFAWGSSGQSLQRHIGGLVEGRSGDLLSGVGVHAQSFWLRSLPNTVVSIGHIAGDALRLLNQNRHQWTPSKWLGSTVSPSDGSPPTTWCHFLWISVGGATMWNESWVWPEVGTPGRVSDVIDCCRHCDVTRKARSAWIRCKASRFSNFCVKTNILFVRHLTIM